MCFQCAYCAVCIMNVLLFTIFYRWAIPRRLGVTSDSLFIENKSIQHSFFQTRSAILPGQVSIYQHIKMYFIAIRGVPLQAKNYASRSDSKRDMSFWVLAESFMVLLLQECYKHVTYLNCVLMCPFFKLLENIVIVHQWEKIWRFQ